MWCFRCFYKSFEKFATTYPINAKLINWSQTRCSRSNLIRAVHIRWMVINEGLVYRQSSAMINDKYGDFRSITCKLHILQCRRKLWKCERLHWVNGGGALLIISVGTRYLCTYSLFARTIGIVLGWCPQRLYMNHCRSSIQLKVESNGWTAL